MDTLTIPGDPDGALPGPMPDTTWAEVLAWFAENDVDLDLCPPACDIVITNTIDRWQTPSEHIPLPVEFVSTPVTVPLPAHLRVAIVRAVTGDEPSGGLRTPDEWCAQYGIAVTDPRGWRDQSWHIPVAEDEFVHRTSLSRLRQLPLSTTAPLEPRLEPTA